MAFLYAYVDSRFLEDLYSLKIKVFVNAQTGNLVFYHWDLQLWDVPLIKNALATFCIFLGIIISEIDIKEINEVSNLIWEKFLLFLVSL